MKTNLQKTSSRSFFGRLSLQQRLLLLIGLLLLLVITAFTVIFYIYAKNAALQTGQVRLKNLTDQLTVMFGQSAESILTTTKKAAANEILVNKITAPHSTPDTTVFAALKKLQPDSTWLLTELLDTEGRQLAATGTTIAVDRKALLASFNFRSGQQAVGKLQVINDSVIYPVAAAVTDKEKIIGYLLRWRVQSASPDAINRFSQLLGEGTILYAGNRDGSAWSDLRRSVPAPVSHALSATKPIPNTQWSIWVELSRTSVLGPVNRLLRWSIFIGVLILMAGLVLTWLLSRSITKPIRKLTAVASAVADGHYSLQVNLRRSDELGQLAHTFNSMLQQIRDNSQVQEKKIKERTLELEHNIIRLEKSEDKFRGLLESAPDGMVIVNDKGSIVLVNKQAEILFGYTREEMIGQPVEMLVPMADREEHKKHRVNYSHSSKARAMGAGMELFALRKDGSGFPVEISLSPMETIDGLLVSAAIRDITERKQADEAIRQLNKELESFTYSVSHDLRAPLRIIDGYADIVIEDYAGKLDEGGKETLAVIKSNARRMGQLIDALLNLSHTGRKEPDKQLADINKMVNSVVEEQVQQKENGPQFKVERLEPVSCDSSLIRQVWVNLISNAIKYSGKQDEPVIEISSSRNGSYVTYSVKDNGVGFDMKYADKLFGVFQRLHKVTEFEGTGVGLALVNRIVLKHGGKIWAESEPGKGASFFFTLPV